MMASLGWFVSADHVLIPAVDQRDVIWRHVSRDVCFIWVAYSLLIYRNFSVNTIAARKTETLI